MWKSTAGLAGCRWAHSSLRSGWRSGRGDPHSSPWRLLGKGLWEGSWQKPNAMPMKRVTSAMNLHLQWWWYYWQIVRLIWLIISPAVFILPPEWDSTNRPLKRALVRKFTTKRPWSLIRMLVGYNAPGKNTHKQTGFYKRTFLNNLMWISLSTETQSVIFWPSKELTLQFGLRGAADAVLPENGSVVHESEPQLWLQVEVLPATGSHGRVEHVRHVQRHAQGHVGLDQVKHLQGRFEMF